MVWPIIETCCKFTHCWQISFQQVIFYVILTPVGVIWSGSCKQDEFSASLITVTENKKFFEYLFEAADMFQVL